MYVWPRMLVFCFFARGYIDLICWFAVTADTDFPAPDARSRGSSSGTALGIRRRNSYKSELAVNVALKKEMTGYLSRGLQASAFAAGRDDPDRSKGFRIINLRDPNEPAELLALTPTKFFRLVFGDLCCNDSARRRGSSRVLYYASSIFASTGRLLSRNVNMESLRLFSPGKGDPQSRTEVGPYLQEHLPDVFRAIRNTFAVDETTFQHAWGANLELKLNDGGSSQAFFFFSSDKRFIVKSCTPKEMLLLKNIAPDFAHHFSCFPQSFLVRIYG